MHWKYRVMSMEYQYARYIRYIVNCPPLERAMGSRGSSPFLPRAVLQAVQAVLPVRLCFVMFALSNKLWYFNIIAKHYSLQRTRSAASIFHFLISQGSRNAVSDDPSTTPYTLNPSYTLTHRVASRFTHLSWSLMHSKRREQATA